MQIQDIAVIDPRKHGEYRDPYIEIKVDEAVQELGEPITKENGTRSSPYRLIPCGPFMAPEFYEDGGWYDLAETSGDYGVLNKIGLIQDQLHPVVVVSPIETLDLAMPVQRLRRMLRAQYGEKWQIAVSDSSALRGRLKWRLELRTRMCYGGAKPRADVCHRTATDEVVVHDTHLPVCKVHLADEQNKMKNLRLTRKS